MKTKVFEDNQGAKSLAENPLRTSNCTHIGVHHHFLSKLVTNGDIRVECISVKEQHAADILSRALHRESSEVHREYLMGHHKEGG